MISCNNDTAHHSENPTTLSGSDNVNRKSHIDDYESNVEYLNISLSQNLS